MSAWLSDSASATQSETWLGMTGGKVAGRINGCGATPLRPTNWSSVTLATSRSFSAAISLERARSARASASRVSVMVALPTSKLRLAEASCSAMALLLPCTEFSASAAASTLK